MQNRSTLLLTSGFLVLLLMPTGVYLLYGKPANDGSNKYALLIGSYDLAYLDPFKYNYGQDLHSDGHYTKPCVACYGQTPYFKDIPYAMKDMLINYFGWKEENILLLYEKDATKEKIMEGLMWLKGHDAEGNILLVDWEMHGSFVNQVNVQTYAWFGAIWGDEPGVDEMAMAYDSDPFTGKDFVYDDELRYLFGEDMKGQWVWIFGCCYSEGLGDDFQGKNKVILCADGEHEMTITADPETGMHLFEYYVMKALQGETGENIPYCDLNVDPDADGNGIVSVEEAFNWTVLALEQTDQTIIAWGLGPSNPVMFDGVEGETYL